MPMTKTDEVIHLGSVHHGLTSNNINNNPYPMTTTLTMTHLCIVWYTTIALLGVATGLLAASSTVCEQQLTSRYNSSAIMIHSAVVSATEEKFLPNPPLIKIECSVAVSMEDGSVNDIKDIKESLSVPRTVPCYRRPIGQKLVLTLWVLALLWAQLEFFQWVMQVPGPQSAATMELFSMPTSSCVAMFGLFTSVAMFTIGIRILPLPIDRHVK
ncbi:hypothetical protein BGZ94_002840 [Podila epigama]|nr:hypothetical protein BGZ94_002840 [Podila epigama]